MGISSVRAFLTLALCAGFRGADARVHIYGKFSEVLVRGPPSCKTLVVQSDAARGAGYEAYSAASFQRTPSVEGLHIINKIHTLEPLAFQRLHHLRTLRLEENNLPTLKSGDFGNLHLCTLSVADNNIEVLEARAFHNSTIDSIDLSHNRLKTIAAHALDGAKLTHLSLAHNEIEHIAERAFSVDLVRLDLSGNRIRNVPITIFENLFALRYLNVSRNRLPTLGSVLWLRELEVLDASHNAIRLLLNGAFEDYPKLRDLRLDHNELLYLNPASFTKPSPVEVLHVQDNMLSFLPAESAAIFTNLRLMRYGGNPWSCACLARVEAFVKTASIRTDACEKRFFTDGKHAVCLTAYADCFFNETLVLLEYPLMISSLVAGYPC